MLLLILRYLNELPLYANITILGVAGFWAGRYLRSGLLAAITIIELTALAYLWYTSHQEIMIVWPLALSVYEAIFLFTIWVTFILSSKPHLAIKNLGKYIFRNN